MLSFNLIKLTLLLHLSPITVQFGLNLMKVSEVDVAQIICPITLLRKYFASVENLSGSVISMSITSSSQQLQEKLLQRIHSYSNYPWTVTVVHDKVLPKLETEHILYEKPQCYFIIVDNLEDVDLKEIFDNWKIQINWNPMAQFVVYLSTIEETDDEMTDFMIEILLNFMDKKIYNVNVIGQSEENTYYYGKTTFPYHPDNDCGNRVIAIETLDTCDYLEKEVEIEEEDSEEIDDNQEVMYTEDDAEAQETETVQAIEENEEIEENEIEYHAKLINVDDQLSSNYIDTSDNIDENINETEINSNKTEIYPKLIVEEFNRALFKDKFPKDLGGCPLTAGYRPWEPYIFRLEAQKTEDSYYDGEENETMAYEDDAYDESLENDIKLELEDNSFTVSKLNGIEYQMIKTIGKLLNIKIEIKIENSNVFSLFQQLMDNEIEIIIGGIDEDPGFSQYVSSTIPYHQDDLTWCVAKAQRKHSFFNFLLTFKYDSWILILIFVMITSLTLLLAQNLLGERIRELQGYVTVYIRILGIVFTQSIQLKKLSATFSLIFGICFFMGLMFSNTYQSVLISTLTTSRSSYQISHTEEIYSRRMTIMGSAENVRHLSKEGEIFKYIREKFQMCYNIVDCLNSAAADEQQRIAVAVSRQHSFYNPRIQRNQLYCFDRNENLYVYLVTMLMPKKFHLLHQINPVIQHIIESGHIQKWARDLDMRRKIHEELGRVRKERFKKLTLTQFVGVFLCGAVLLFFAIFIFALEQWANWMVQKRNTRLKIARYLHCKFRAQLC